jgi:hypothetical protein
MDLGEALGRAGGRVDVVTAKVGAVLEGLGDGEVRKVLVSKGHHLALGDKVSQLILAGGAERRQLDARHF